MARVRLFANLRELAGTSNVEADGDTVDEVIAELVERYGPDFHAALGTTRIWKNGDEATGGDPVTATDELALIPPVSGGATALPEGGGYENLFLAGAVVVLLAANTAADVSWFAACLVGVAAIWAVDISANASSRDLVIDAAPLLASIPIAVLTIFGFGAAGLGIAAMLSVIIVLSWAVVRPEARDLTSIAATTLAALMGALGVGSLLLTRVSTNGEMKVAGFIIMAMVSVLIGLTVSRMRRQMVDQFMASAVATVVAALVVAARADFDLLQWFFVGLLVSIAFISGRGLGAAFRTGQVFLSDPMDGSLAAMDGPMLAAGIFVPFLRLISDGGEVLASISNLVSL